MPKSNLPKIFVQIASYRDAECQWTVWDLFRKAKHPERVNVGICWQFIEDEDEHMFAVPYTFPKQVKVKEVDARESKGAGWARAEAQKLCGTEKYTLQIDSHMRFVENWDEILINMIKSLKSDRAAITLFLPDYTPPNSFQDTYGLAIRLRITDMAYPEHAAVLHLGGEFIGKEDSRNGFYRSPFIIGNFLFGPSKMFKDVPIDPYIFFNGDEISYSARLWTHGYDIFQPDTAPLYHRWTKEMKDGIKNYKSTENSWAKLTTARVHHLLKINNCTSSEAVKEVENYGLGNKRSLESFWKFIGVDIAQNIASDEAKKGFWQLNHLPR